MLFHFQNKAFFWRKLSHTELLSNAKLLSFKCYNSVTILSSGWETKSIYFIPHNVKERGPGNYDIPGYWHRACHDLSVNLSLCSRLGSPRVVRWPHCHLQFWTGHLASADLLEHDPVKSKPWEWLAGKIRSSTSVSLLSHLTVHYNL